MTTAKGVTYVSGVGVIVFGLADTPGAWFWPYRIRFRGDHDQGLLPEAGGIGVCRVDAAGGDGTMPENSYGILFLVPL